jgi:hypothetical protein
MVPAHHVLPRVQKILWQGIAGYSSAIPEETQQTCRRLGIVVNWW